MYKDYKNYPNLSKLPDDLESSLMMLDDSKTLREAFGEEVINSYIKLKNQEIDVFSKNDVFDKKDL